MPDIISAADLLIDEQNPRILQPNEGQHKAIQALAQLQGRKLLVLAKDIVSYGLNPSELSIVMRHEGDPKRYVVLEGNRRLAAVRALENPELLAGAVQPSVLTEMRKLSRAYQDNPVESVECLVVGNRAEGEHWIELRHTGERGGAGIVPWGPDEKARFTKRKKGLALHQQALDFLERRGDLSAEERQTLPSSTLQRLIETPEVRSKLGVEVQNGHLFLRADEQRVAKALLHITHDLVSRKMNVGDVYRKEQRVAYANSLPRTVVVTPTKKSGEGVDINTGEVQEKPRRAKAAKMPKERDRLIPTDCVINVSDPRCHEIERELRKLSLEQFRNAVSVLFRVFIELSADEYVQKARLTLPQKHTLSNKLQAVATDLVARNKLTEKQAKPVRRASQADMFLAATTASMNNYVHNQYWFPSPTDLRVGWNNLQPFVTAIWAP